ILGDMTSEVNGYYRGAAGARRAGSLPHHVAKPLAVRLSHSEQSGWCLRTAFGRFCRDRNVVRATVGGEFPICTLSVVQRVPSSTLVPVSTSPPTIPDGRLSRVRFWPRLCTPFSRDSPSYAM